MKGGSRLIHAAPATSSLLVLGKFSLATIVPDAVSWVSDRRIEPTAAGLAIGLPAALVSTRLVQTQLFGLHASDPATIILATLSITGVAVLAGYVPARRATSIDPMRTLRWE